MTEAKSPQGADGDTTSTMAAPLPAALPHNGDAPTNIMGMPIEVFVRGDRTRPMAHDNEIAAREADAERRRDVAAAERKMASQPIGAQGGAMMYQNRFNDSPDAQESYFELKYVTSRGEPFYMQGQELGCLADLQLLPDNSLQFIMVCPKCKASGLPQAECQMTVNTRNKKFEFDPAGPADIIMFNDGFGVRPYRSAGKIRETERFRCDRCSWACRIVNNCVRPD